VATDIARRHPENVAAGVNALLTLFLPAALLLLAIFAAVTGPFVMDSGTSVTVHPERSFFAVTREFLSALAHMMILFVPFSLIAGWRTWVHARRYRDRRGTGWQGVLEAGLVGFLAALLVLWRGIATRPMEALPYIIVYGGGAAFLGLALGLLLRTTARMVLKRLAG
jgi:hypothetical protein